MEDKTMLTFPAFFASTLSRFGTRDALALVGKRPLTYAETNDSIMAVIAFLEKLGIQPGDKVAILSTNQPNWGIVYYAITFMGAIAVPLLPEFLPIEISALLEHSETRVVFASGGLLPKLVGLTTDYLLEVVRIEDFSVVRSYEYWPAFDPDAKPSKEYQVEEDDVAAIIYTSGTTGNPKGVMLTHRNICFNAIKGFEIQHMFETDRFLSPFSRFRTRMKTPLGSSFQCIVELVYIILVNRQRLQCCFQPCWKLSPPPY